MSTYARWNATFRPSSILVLMRSGRCLVLTALVVGIIAAPRIEAQQCYIKTNEYAFGNFFVKAVSDSTCFGQFYDTLHYQNYKTREVYYQFMSKEYHGLPGIGRPYVTDIVQYDSIIVVSWENGQVIRFLKIDKSSRITEVSSVLDQMPLVKYELGARSFDARKIRKVNDSILVIGNEQKVFSFVFSDDTIKCVDSLLIWDPVRFGNRFDVKDDTLVILAINEKLAIFYHITQNGRFRETEVVKVDRNYYPRVHVKYGHGNFYFTEDGLDALIRTDTGFVFKSGRSYYDALDPLILPHTVALIDMGNWDQIDIYTPNLDTICIKPGLTMRYVLSWSNWGDKIFIARSDGVSTWIPDTTSVSIVDTQRDALRLDLEIWPNPSVSGTFNVTCNSGISSITVTSMLGRIVYSNRGDFDKTIVVDSPELRPGIYFVTVESDHMTIRKRIAVLLE